MNKTVWHKGPQPEQEPIRNLLISAAALAVAAERSGQYQGASWVADAVLGTETAPTPQPEQEPVAWHLEGTDIEECDAAIAASAEPEQEPFKPDWANYRQGVEDGRAEALEILAKQEPVAWIEKAMELATDFAVESLRVGSHERKDSILNNGVYTFETTLLRDKREAARERLRTYLYTAAPTLPTVPKGYALVSIAALKAWNKYDEVLAACQYSIKE